MEWEYYRLTAVETNLDGALSDLGKEGWELVAVLPESRLFHGFHCVFKRPFTGQEPARRGHTRLPLRVSQYPGPQ